MTREDFASEIEELLEEKENQNIPAWIAWAEECVDAEQYAALVEKPREEAIGLWLTTYVTVLKAVKRDLGVDGVKHIINLGGHPCLYPYEMEIAARLLVAGATPDVLYDKIGDGLLERADCWPMYTHWDGTGDLPPLPPFDEDYYNEIKEL